MEKTRTVLTLSVVGAAAVWLIDALCHWLVVGGTTFLEELTPNVDSHRFYFRSVVMLGLLLVGFVHSRIAARHRATKQQLDLQAGLLDQIDDLVTASDLEGRITYVNAAAAARLGRSKAELIGQSVLSFGESPTRGAKQRDILQETLKHGGWRGEVVNISSDGQEVILDARTWVIRDADGNALSLCGCSTDVTHRVQAQEALRRECDRMQKYLDIAGVMFVVIDREGKVLLINRKGCEILGCAEAEVVGKDWFDHFLPERNRKRVRGIFEGLLAGEIERLEYAEGPVRTASGDERTILWHNTVFRNEQGCIVATLGSGTDLTEMRGAEAERRKLEAQIQHAQKLESLGVLAGGIAHDFNNLLMGILGNAGLAKMELPPESPARPSIEHVEKAAVRAADLTKQMLAYSGRGQFVVEPINLSALVEEMPHLLEAVISKKVVLKYDFAPDLPPVEADATQLRQVVMNLITNASEAIGQRSGVVTVSTGVTEASRAYFAGAHLDDNLPAGLYAFIEVSDTGCGMTAETRSKIFDPFYTTKKTGRGLGLAAVLGIVRGHQGAIKVYSEPGRGTTFKVLLPCSQEPQPSTLNIPQAADRFAGEGTILVVDDEETCRAVAGNILRAAGFTVLTATNGRDAVQTFTEHADDIDLVLLDLTMPVMAGDAAFREMRRIRPDAQVVLSSGYNEQDAADKLITKGLSGFIQKPYGPTELLDKVRAVLGI